MPATHYTDAAASASNTRASWARHTHTVNDATGSAICGKVKDENLVGGGCDRDAPPTCPVCAKRDPRFK